MDVTRFAIEKNRITAVFLLVVVATGLSAFTNLPRNEDPGFIVRTALVQTEFPGASPARVEQLVTDKLEKAIQEMPELDSVVSESKSGVSLVYANFKETYTEMRPIYDKLRRKVETASRELPDGVRGPFVNDEFGDVFGIVIAVQGDSREFSYRELKDVADEVREELLLLEEVAKVDIYGEQDERVFVEYNNARLAELGLSPTQLQQILQSRNIISGGGEVRTQFEELVLEPSGNFESVDDLRRTVINIPDSDQVVFLQDVAEIRRSYIDPPTSLMRASGEPALALAVSMRDGGNIIDLGKQVNGALEFVQSTYPIGIDFDVVLFQPQIVDDLVADFVNNLLQAIVIVTGVMLLFLGFRTGFIVASLIPMAMLMALAVMQFFNIGLDQVSIASLIIALGMLVDNAIVMSESIMVQMAAGKRRVDAAIDSAAELRIPLLTSTLTTAAAFLPIFLAESSVGEYTAPLFKVVTITLLCSWLLALTMVPMLCVAFLKIKAGSETQSFDGRFYGLYRGFLIRALRHRWISALALIALFAVGMFAFSFVPALFFPASDRATFTAELKLPDGTPLERTEAVVEEIEAYLRSELAADETTPGITNWVTYVGDGGPRFSLGANPAQRNPSIGFMILNTTDRPTVDRSIAAIDDFAAARFPDLRATVQPMASGTGGWPPVAVRLSGRDVDKLFDIVERVKAKMREIPGTRLIGDDWGARSKKLRVEIDQARAQDAGVTNADIATSLQAFVSGIEATEYREGDDLIPVTLRSTASERQDLARLETLNVYAQSTGRSVPLKQVADIAVEWQPAVILRYDRLKTVTVECGLKGATTAAEVTAALTEWLEQESRSWGLGYSWEMGGDAESSAEANESIGEKLPIAGMIIVLLLVAQFNSIRRPAIILATIPLSLIGVAFGLLIMRSYFGFMTLLGVISLAGIVINNAIVLLDRIKIERDSGNSPQYAVIEAAQQRLRPILLTTCTTIAGMIPLYVSGGSMWEPMAVAIMFGLLFATVLTLGAVPLLYSIGFGVGFRDYRHERPS